MSRALLSSVEGNPLSSEDLSALRGDERALAVWVDSICEHLDQVQGIDTHLTMGFALDCFGRWPAKRVRQRITVEQRDRMMKAAARARFFVVKHIDGDGEVETSTTQGMDALAGLILLWAETDEQRAARHPHIALDLADYLALLRADLRRLEILQDIENRAYVREADRVSALCPVFS